jgi:predicted HTH domain antitoxin
MPILISDELLSEAGLSEREATVEIACRLFAAGRLAMPTAAKWTGLTRVAFEQELLSRKLPLVVVDDDYWQQELATLRSSEPT